MSERIYTRCPACGNDTLAIGEDRHLICTWIKCPDPLAIDKAALDHSALREEVKRWIEETKAVCRLKLAIQSKIEIFEKALRESEERDKDLIMQVRGLTDSLIK